MQQQLKYLQPDVVSKLANMELRARLVVEGFITGLHKSPYHGFSVEFAEHRQYMPGDEIRRIDWRVYGKTDRFYVKQFEEETNLKSYIVIDTSASMRFASEIDKKGTKRISKIEYASFIAASLSYLMVQQRDAVGLMLYDSNIRTTIPPHATKQHLRRVLVELEKVRPSQSTNSASALHQLADRISRRGLVIVVSDLFDDPDKVVAALKHFRHDNHEVLVMHILDPLERSFAFGTDAVFKDVETGEMVTTQPYHIQKAYQEAMKDFIERYKRECRENMIDYVLLDTATPFDVALLNYLNKRQRIG
ncbi:MAG: DUF58 domain-containing protein [Ignavibacteriales bacterium]|nr:DUF58 domain-containing protein [Ignavibacteriales bacterium]